MDMEVVEQIKIQKMYSGPGRSEYFFKVLIRVTCDIRAIFMRNLIMENDNLCFNSESIFLIFILFPIC